MKLMILASFFLFSFAVIAQDKDEEVNEAALVKFEEQEYNFGEALEGETVQHVFKFVNEGNETLLISNVITSCGCTIVDWKREPVRPGKKGFIVAKFDTTHRLGQQTKTITILSNSSNHVEKVNMMINVRPRQEAQVTTH